MNVGGGDDLPIKTLAKMIANVGGFKGSVLFDRSKPYGGPRKLMDSTRLRNTGWKPRVELKDGLARAYEDFLVRAEQGRAQNKSLIVSLNALPHCL